MFEDAYQRKSCAAVLGNAHAILDAIGALADEAIGPQKYMKDECEREAYWAKRCDIQVRIKAGLAQHVRRVLTDSNGIVLSSLLQAAYRSEEAYLQAKRRLPHLMEEMLAGRGGTGDDLDPLQCDAFAHVYGLPVSKFKTEWLKTPSLQHYLEGHMIRDCYALTWKRRRMKAPKNSKIKVALAA